MTPEQQVQRVRELHAWHDEDLEVDHLIAEYRSLAPALAGWVERLVEALEGVLQPYPRDYWAMQREWRETGSQRSADFCTEADMARAERHERARALLAEYRLEGEK